jgi:hypothetical protein
MIALKLIKVLIEFTLVLVLVGCDVAADDAKVRSEMDNELLFSSSLCSVMFHFCRNLIATWRFILSRILVRMTGFISTLVKYLLITFNYSAVARSTLYNSLIHTHTHTHTH